MIKPKITKKDNGFTLIELLVVISIIALLISILMPALNKARKQAKFAVCSSNQHQLLIGLNTYMSDNDGKLPPSSCLKTDNADGVDTYYRPFAWCLIIIEQPDRLAIRPETRHDRSSLQPLQVFLSAIAHFGLGHEVFVPANKNYSYTS